MTDIDPLRRYLPPCDRPKQNSRYSSIQVNVFLKMFSKARSKKEMLKYTMIVLLLRSLHNERDGYVGIDEGRYFVENNADRINTYVLKRMILSADRNNEFLRKRKLNFLGTVYITQNIIILTLYVASIIDNDIEFLMKITDDRSISFHTKNY